MAFIAPQGSFVKYTEHFMVWWMKTLFLWKFNNNLHRPLKSIALSMAFVRLDTG
jgi:hypothetical protein